MKTAVTVLQEMMVKMGLMPEYECVSQSGPQHQSLFEYRCLACGEVALAAARSKKEAKQEVARVMLLRLSNKGHPVPPPYGRTVAASAFHEDDVVTGSPSDTRSYVALLKELCTEYRLASVEYELVGDTGPPHLRHFTVRATLGSHERIATATTKKTARQVAAEKLYTYLRENLSRLTRDFDEEEALARAHDKTMDRYQEPEEPQRRPDLGQKIADYHLGLTERLDEATLQQCREVLREERERDAHSPERVVARVADVLRLDVAYTTLGTAGDAPLALLELSGTSPDLVFGGEGNAEAAREALAYVRRVALNADVLGPAPAALSTDPSTLLCP